MEWRMLKFIDEDINISVRIEFKSKENNYIMNSEQVIRAYHYKQMEYRV